MSDDESQVDPELARDLRGLKCRPSEKTHKVEGIFSGTLSFIFNTWKWIALRIQHSFLFFGIFSSIKTLTDLEDV